MGGSCYRSGGQKIGFPLLEMGQSTIAEDAVQLDFCNQCRVRYQRQWILLWPPGEVQERQIPSRPVHE